MKANRAQVERALDKGGAGVRFFLLYGPDESQSRDLAARLGKSLGAEAERIDLTGVVLKSDPARLSDEAAAISLFGGPRHIRVEPAGDDVFEAVEALLQSPEGGNPVVIVAGALRKDSRLLKLALSDATAMAFASYLPEGQDSDRLAIAIAREHGLYLHADIPRLLSDGTGGDRMLLTREIEKLALYVDAAPDRTAELSLEDYTAIVATQGDGDISRLIDHVLIGQGEALLAELSRLTRDGIEGIALLRPLLKRLLLLAQLRAHLEQGEAIDVVMNGPAARAVFWKEKAAVSRQLTRWNATSLQRAIERVLTAERSAKAPGSLGSLGIEAEFVALCREASRRR